MQGFSGFIYRYLSLFVSCLIDQFIIVVVYDSRKAHGEDPTTPVNCL